MKFIMLLLITAFLFSGCATTYKLDETEKLFSATFSCPKNESMPAWVEPVSMRKMAGVYVMTSDISDRIEAVRGPVKYITTIFDGTWRPQEFIINNKKYMGEIKSDLLAKNKIQFTTKLPTYIDKNNKKVKAGTNKRVVKIDQNGNWVRFGNKVDSPICLRQ